MITEKEAYKQLEKWWPAVLTAGLSSTSYFPKAIRSIGKPKPREWMEDFSKVRSAQERWLKRSRPRKPLGWSLEWQERDYRSIGRNRFIHKIYIERLEDYLFLLGREDAYANALADAALIGAAVPALGNWCQSNPLDVTACHGQWEDLLKVVRYFMDEQEAGRFYIRELPLDIPTKFIENHRRVLGSLLDTVLPEERIDSRFRGVRQFEQRYGLKYRQPLIRLRIMDEQLAQEHFSGLQDLALPLDSLAKLDLPVQRAVILENKTNFANLMNFLTLPQAAGTIGIFGSGFGVGALGAIKWLRGTGLWYWGDIDAHGLQILAQLRGYHPHVQPFLMDRSTLDTFEHYASYDAPLSPVTELPNLTEPEQALFEHLNAQRMRLEQEHIPLEYVKTVLSSLL